MTKSKNYNNGPETNATTIDDNEVEITKPNLKGDWMNLFLLTLLYAMQGVLFGITSSIPILIQNKKNVQFIDQAKFSISSYPFSMKLLWAPLVDALYVRKFGRRKSWLIPTQYLIGIILVFTAYEIDSLIPETGNPNIVMLTCIFFSTIFLAATQDIAVDGWSLTILKKNNVCYAPICNSVGQIIGGTLGKIPLILFTSEDFCNNYLRSTPVYNQGGILSLKTMILGWAILFITITTSIAVFKKEEKRTIEDKYVRANVFQTYSILWYILKLPSVQLLIVIMITVKIGYAPVTVDIVSLKLINIGVSKNMITILGSSMAGVNLILPIALANIVSGRKAMDVYRQTSILRLPMNVAFALLIYYTPQLLDYDKTAHTPVFKYIFGALYLLQDVLSYSMFVALQSFFSQISDDRFGGTYMTLLNTFHNFGNLWTISSALALLDVLTFSVCSRNSTNNFDNTTDLLKPCGGNQGKHTVQVDGYYVEVLVCTIVGIVWYFIFRKKMKSLKTMNASDWMIKEKNSELDNVNNEYCMDGYSLNEPKLHATLNESN